MDLPRVAVLDLVFIKTRGGVLGESLELPNESQATFLLMGNAGWIWSQCRGIEPYLEFFGVH